MQLQDLVMLGLTRYDVGTKAVDRINSYRNCYRNIAAPRPRNCCDCRMSLQQNTL